MNSSAKDVTTYSRENVETQHRQLEQGMQQCSNKWWMAGATMLHVLHVTKTKNCYLLLPFSLTYYLGKHEILLHLIASL
jgi:hypothetical protein